MGLIAAAAIVYPFIIALFYLLLLPLAIYRGWALSILWGWFMAPLGLPSLTMVQCIGIALVIGFLTPSLSLSSYIGKPVDSKGKEVGTSRMKFSPQWGASLGTALVSPIGAVFFGWLILHFFGYP